MKTPYGTVGHVPIYVKVRTPTNGLKVAFTEWGDICHDKTPWVLVSHFPGRHIGRWGYEERKRPFMVNKNGYGPGNAYSTHYTFEAAIKSAYKHAAEINERIEAKLRKENR